ncbi:hypothetical protein [Streptomyces zagrosensis]|uniref:Uncharacterized protein n=1 Tax=Streptomyces zagrosensis TaxID=1042984 RepID=A0A7W9Q810_9ACTN|nr:hypothetical protein [Streptomyces zagrosensis]MBB5935300.1 hypothetical protein [Streptomyces zagrosensis]
MGAESSRLAVAWVGFAGYAVLKEVGRTVRGVVLVVRLFGDIWSVLRWSPLPAAPLE